MLPFGSPHPDRRHFLGLAAAFACVDMAAATAILPKPGPRDVCPVCGMFVAPYPYWIAALRHGDGEVVFFDGAKDLFKYLLTLGKYAPGKSRAAISTMAVTDYYGTESIDAKSAFYVIGSDVFGPMGHELVPHATEAEAKDFLTDHKGRRIIRFEEVTMALLAQLDAGSAE